MAQRPGQCRSHDCKQRALAMFRTARRAARAFPASSRRETSGGIMGQWEDAVQKGKQALSTLETVRATGFVPDIILNSSVSGAGLCLRQAFPEAFLVHYIERVPNAADAKLGTSSTQCRQGWPTSPLPGKAFPASCGRRWPSIRTISGRSASGAAKYHFRLCKPAAGLASQKYCGRGGPVGGDNFAAGPQCPEKSWRKRAWFPKM